MQTINSNINAITLTKKRAPHLKTDKHNTKKQKKTNIKISNDDKFDNKDPLTCDDRSEGAKNFSIEKCVKFVNI